MNDPAPGLDKGPVPVYNSEAAPLSGIEHAPPKSMLTSASQGKFYTQAPVAQWIEHSPPKRGVGRSNRLWGARNAVISTDCGVYCFSDTSQIPLRLMVNIG